jgi:serine/threonine-protein kinase
MNNDSPNLTAGALLQGGKYKIIKVLGQGGFGITYLAEQTGLDMKVAIKEFFLKGSCQRDSATSEVRVPVRDNRELVDRCQKKFRSEAKKIASLNNDHIVNIIDVFDENGTSYYVMKYLGRGSLADKVKGFSLPEEVALNVIREVADALESVHDNGLLHLDVKPANILFDERGRAVLIDFGVSKYVDSDQDTATTSSLVGFSRGFAPLEQMNATGTSLSPASDIYALGATLYNLVVGITPPDASTIMDSGVPALPPDVSEEVKNAIVKSMQPRRKDRPQNIRAFLDLLPEESRAELEEDPTILKIEHATPEVIIQKPRGSKLYMIVASAMLAGAIAIAGITFFGSGKRDTGNRTTVTDNSEALNQQINSLTIEKETLQKQVNDLNSKVNNLNSSNQTLRNENSANKSEISRLNRLVNDYREDAEKWRRSMRN